MKPFTKNEIIGVSSILLLILIFTLFNLRVSVRRARDAQRKADINAISDALGVYQKDFGFFPPSTPDGKILACKGENFGSIPEAVPEGEKRDYFFKMLRGCSWGDDGLYDVNDDGYAPYLKFIPKDPKTDYGISYFYISNMNRYQIFAYLEGENDEAGYRDGIVSRNIGCGKRICNFGKAFGETPLEVPIGEYENSLNTKK